MRISALVIGPFMNDIVQRGSTNTAPWFSRASRITNQRGASRPKRLRKLG
jgi:hypothetical protein